MTAALIGAALALAVGIVFSRLGFARDRSFYPTVMIVIAAYYVLFALMDGTLRALLPELVVFAAFASAAIAGFKWSPWFVVAALAAHGTFDLAHPHLITNGGVPTFWPAFCSTYDIVAAVYLAALQGPTRFGSSLGSADPRTPCVDWSSPGSSRRSART